MECFKSVVLAIFLSHAPTFFTWVLIYYFIINLNGSNFLLFLANNMITGYLNFYKYF